MLYLIVIFVGFIWLVSPHISDYSSERFTNRVELRRKRYLVASFSIIVFCALRDPFIYPDNISYYSAFLSDWRDVSDTYNWGYIWFNKFIAFFWKNYYFFSVICACIICGSYCKFIKDYSPYIFLSLILFIFINYYFSFFLIRQYLAMPFLLLSIRYIIKQKFLKFIFCIALAVSMHSTAAVFLPLYFLYQFNYNTKNMLLVFAFTIISAASLMAVGEFLAQFFPMYSHYMTIELEEGSAWQRAVMKVFIFFVFVYSLWKENLFYRKGINRIIFYSMILNVVICVGAMDMFGVYRLRDYFSLADFVGVPVILYYNRLNPKSKRFIVFSMTCLYVILLFISFVSFVNSDNMNNSYQFFWNGHPHEWSK